MSDKKTQNKTGAKSAAKTGARSAGGAKPARSAAPVKNSPKGNKAASGEAVSLFASEEAALRTKKSVADASRPVHQIAPFLFIVCAVIFVIFLVSGESGILGSSVSKTLFWLFGYAAWAVPVIICIYGITWRRSVETGTRVDRLVFSVVCLLFLCSLLGTVFNKELVETVINASAGGTLKAVLSSDIYRAGGHVGGFLSAVLLLSIGFTATVVVSASFLALTAIFTLGITPKTIIIFIRYRRRIAAEKRREREERLLAAQAAKNAVFEGYGYDPARDNVRLGENIGAMTAKKTESEKEETLLPQSEEKRCVPLGIDNIVSDADAALKTPSGVNTKTGASLPLTPVASDGGEEDTLPILSEIFKEKREAPKAITDLGLNDEHTASDNQATLDVCISKTGDSSPSPASAVKPKADKPKPRYIFPPVSILNEPEPVKAFDIRRELEENALKLVQTLSSFRVKTKITDVVCGPTITRYEIAPEAGTSVRSIINHMDDIALSFATRGVRIEAPIQGKAAVGIEVPNKIVAIVTLRELIDSPYFFTGEKLTVCLGKDVAGAPIYMNLAKMPHLLIAGATGMGKSVCINSIIISLLYKASPEDVKLILIDPKKVEFTSYEHLPHLLVPVVTDTHKAAGALGWAVGEMERRFERLKEVGERNIDGYHRKMKTDPTLESMPLIVIIIDELASLMLDTKDTVETSINKLTAKARAAGMHLIVGTQRPSVDVVTGLIKANIPSRIAFTVASQVDSKTIIDTAGADKLIGRGDMLYAPVGLLSPLRVQGAFVSTPEVDAVVNFVCEAAGNAEFDERVIEGIDKEAARCAQNKRGGGSDTFDDDESGDMNSLDPKFRQALDIAVSANKISTSLLQRNLQVGYGRAAKMIDAMERRGFVGPPDGTKPRDVLISREKYMELVANGEI